MGVDRDQLIMDNLKLVPYIVHKYFEANIKQYEDDLIAIGNEGLVKAARTYDERKGVKFSTYACKCIWSHISNEFDRNYRDSVHIPQHVKDRISQKQGKEALLDFKSWLSALSLDRILAETPDSDDAYYFLQSDEEPVEDQVVCKVMVEQTIDQMPERRQAVMRARISNTEKTLGEIGQIFGLSRERVRQIQEDFCRRYKGVKYA